MNKTLLSLLTLLCLADIALAQNGSMTGTTYSIESSVFSQSGIVATSQSGIYTMEASIGQPTPITGTLDLLRNLSGNVEIRPGFWYTVAGMCLFDINGDGVVDGEDLALYIALGDFSKIDQFTLVFGTTCH